MRNPRLFFLVLAFGPAACAGDFDPGPSSVLIENRSQYVLDALQIHEAASPLGAPNLLPAPMEIGDRALYVGEGAKYFSVARERYRGGPRVALTTATPIELGSGHDYALSIFDDSFRFETKPLGDPSCWGGLRLDAPTDTTTSSTTETSTTCRFSGF